MRRMFYGWLLATALTIGPVGAALGEVVFNERIPWSQPVYVPCAAGGMGEVVVIGGTLHVQVHVTTDGSGGYHFGFIYNPQGATGVGLDTNAAYRSTGVTTRHEFNAFTDEFPQVITQVNFLNIRGMTDGIFFRLHNTIHFTVNENGTLTAAVVNSSASCE